MLVCIHALLLAKASTQLDVDGRRPLWAEVKGQPTTAELERGELKKVVEWLNKGGLVDALSPALTEDGQTITFGMLQIATANGHLEIARELLKRGANVDLPSNFGSTALMTAAVYGNLSILLLLLQYSANPDLQDEYGGTALMKAAEEGQEACVQALLRAKANTELLDENGDTALQWAVDQGYTATAELIRQHAAPPPPADASPAAPPVTVEGLSQFVEGPWISRGVVLALCVGLATLLSIVFQKRAFMDEAGARAPEGNRRQGRARDRGRNQNQGRGQGQGRGRGQARRRAVDPRVPTTAPTPSPTAAYAPVEEPDWWLELEEFHDELDAAAGRERPDFACPVTHEIMRVPYMLVDGNESLHTYEYNALVSWFITEGNDTDPARNMRIEPARRNFISDGRLGREIRNWCEDKARMWRQELYPLSLSG